MTPKTPEQKAFPGFEHTGEYRPANDEFYQSWPAFGEGDTVVFGSTNDNRWILRKIEPDLKHRNLEVIERFLDEAERAIKCIRYELSVYMPDGSGGEKEGEKLTRHGVAISRREDANVAGHVNLNATLKTAASITQKQQKPPDIIRKGWQIEMGKDGEVLRVATVDVKKVQIAIRFKTNEYENDSANIYRTFLSDSFVVELLAKSEEEALKIVDKIRTRLIRMKWVPIG